MVSYRGMATFPQVPASISTVYGPILVKLANEFNLSCLPSTFMKKNVFPVEQVKLRDLHFFFLAIAGSIEVC